jgi:hypothetical protein
MTYVTRPSWHPYAHVPASQTSAATAERVAVKLVGVNVLGSRTIRVGLLTAMAADGSLIFAPELGMLHELEQHNVFFHSRNMASLVVPII